MTVIGFTSPSATDVASTSTGSTVGPLGSPSAIHHLTFARPKTNIELTRRKYTLTLAATSKIRRHKLSNTCHWLPLEGPLVDAFEPRRPRHLLSNLFNKLQDPWGVLPRLRPGCPPRFPRLKNTKPISATDPKTGKEGTTVPDGKKPDGQLVEVKDTKRVTDSSQQRLQNEASKQVSGKPSEVVTGEKTQVSKTIQREHPVRRIKELGPQ